jgi:hypothetical protein
MAMGGAVCGGLLGIPLGAALGLIVGLWCGNVSWGLDGAVLGILSLSAAGAVVGGFLGVTADERTLGLRDDAGLYLTPDERSYPSRR